MKKLAVIITASVITVAVLSSPAFSENKAPPIVPKTETPDGTSRPAAFQGTSSEEIKIDGISYRKADIIRDFIEIAFSETFWNSEPGSDYAAFFREFIRDFDEITASPPDKGTFDLRNRRPWLEGVGFRSKGFPREGALNKWGKKTITVGIGWPQYDLSEELMSALKKEVPKTRLQPERENAYKDGKQCQKITYDQASSISEKLKALSDPKNFPLSSSQINEFSEGQQELDCYYASLYPAIERQIKEISSLLKKNAGIELKFISPSDPADKTENFARVRLILTGETEKIKRFPSRNEVPVFGQEEEYKFWGSVPFTPSLKDHPRGYFVPAPDNTIDMAFCYVNVLDGQAAAKANVTECVMRSLGLPDAADNERTVFGAWRKSASMPETPSEYDVLITKLLYCDEVKPGMDKYQTITALVKKEGCFTK